MIDILMPRLSDTMEEGAVAAWHKKPGDAVALGDLLVEIETDKAVMEYEAYEAGTLHEILVPEGDQAVIGEVIARIDDGGGTSAASAPAPAETTVPTAEPASVATPADAAAAAGSPTPAPTARRDPHPAPDRERVFATPLVRRLAREHEIDLERVAGTGPGGRIVRADIEDALAHRRPDATEPVAPQSTPLPIPKTSSAPDLRGSTAVPFDKTRQVISRRLAESSSTTPHFSVTVAADVEDLLALRRHLNDLSADSERPKISVNDLVVRACAIALRNTPGVNASFSPNDRGSTLIHERVNIGIAVASDTGLIVPVILDVDQKTVSQIAAEAKELATLAQEHRLSAAQLSGGTFTISNLGMYGVEQFTAIINPPEGAILAVGSALPEAVVRDGTVEARHRMRVTLSADHRIIDGALAAQFLRALKALLENPMTILV